MHTELGQTIAQCAHTVFRSVLTSATDHELYKDVITHSESRKNILGLVQYILRDLRDLSSLMSLNGLLTFQKHSSREALLNRC